MSYRPDENDLMAYLYGELEGADKEKMEHYLRENPEARKELEKFQQMRNLMGAVEDKEVIAPPIVLGENKQRFLWNAPYFKTIVSIAASLLVIMLVARFSGASITVSGSELKISFGGAAPADNHPVTTPAPALTATQVQDMINSSLNNNNAALQASWQESQQKMDASIRQNLAINSGKMDQVVREASTASQEQIQQYVSTIQTENMALVKDYFQLTSSQQKQYIEGLLVDFAKYLQQQRQDDLQLVQTRLNSLEQNTNVFRQETEQILTSIISTVANPSPKETKY